MLIEQKVHNHIAHKTSTYTFLGRASFNIFCYSGSRSLSDCFAIIKIGVPQLNVFVLKKFQVFNDAFPSQIVESKVKAIPKT